MNPFYELNKKLNSIRADEKQITESQAKPAPKNKTVQTLETALSQDLKTLMEDGTGGMNFSGSGSLEEKFGGDVHLNPAKKGMFKGKNISDLEHQLAQLHKTGPHKKGSPEATKQSELNFAIRAKKHWPKGTTNEAIPMTLEDDMEEATNPLPGQHADPKMRGLGQVKQDKFKQRTSGHPLKNVAKGISAFVQGKKEPMDEEQMMEYLRMKADENSMSHNYNGRPGAADAHNGMFEDDIEEVEQVNHMKFKNSTEKKPNNMTHKSMQKPSGMKSIPGSRNKVSKPDIDSAMYRGQRFSEDDMEEGNAFTGKLKSTPKGGHFELDGKEYTDTSSLEEMDLIQRMKEMMEGFEDLDAYMKKKDKEKGTKKFDKKEISTGTVYTRKHDDEEDDEKETDTKEKKTAGRPKKNKDAGRFTGNSYKYEIVDGKKVLKDKYKKKEKTDESEMMGTHEPDHGGEYGDEGGYMKNEIHTMVRALHALEKHLSNSEDLPTWCVGKMSQAKGMIINVADYIMSEKERGIEHDRGEEGITIAEKSTSEKQARTMAAAAHNPKFAKKVGIAQNVAKEFNQADKGTKQLSMAMKHKKTEEEATPKRDNNAERAGKSVAKDIEYDEKKKDGIHGKKRESEDSKAERAGRKVTKDIEHDEKKKSKKKEVEETTTSGSVSTAAPTGKSGGVSFGKGIYDSYNRSIEALITEGINVSMNKSFGDDNQERSNITISADGEEADMLKDLLRNAGIDTQGHEKHENNDEYCPSCDCDPCECGHEDEHGQPGVIELELDEADVTVSDNEPDYPSNEEYSDNALQYSGGLNKPKSTGQTTIPVLASQTDRQMSDKMSEGRSFLDLYKALEARTR